MQGLADGYFVSPLYTIGDYLAEDIRTGAIPYRYLLNSMPAEKAAVKAQIDVLRQQQRELISVDYLHIENLGKIMWNKCGMSRNAEGLNQAI